MPYRPTLIAALAGMLLPMTAAADWPAFRHDETRTGRSPDAMSITTPVVTWSADMGGTAHQRTLWIGALPPYGQVVAMAQSGRLGLFTLANQVIWRTGAMGITGVVGAGDVDGDGALEFLATIDGPPAGLALVRAEDGAVLWRYAGFGVAAQRFDNGQVRLVDLDGDGAQEVVAAPISQAPDTVAFRFAPSIAARGDAVWWRHTHQQYSRYTPQVFADVDGDGVRDAIWLERTRVVVVDGATGRVLRIVEDAMTTYHGNGQLQVATLDGRPHLFFAGTNIHYAIGAALVDLAQGRVVWQYERYPADGRAVALTFDDIDDFDGDGRQEVVFSAFTDPSDTPLQPQAGGDGAPFHWVTWILDLATGAVKGALPDAKIAFAAHVLGDDHKELITYAAEPGVVGVPAFGGVDVWEVDAGGTWSRALRIDRAAPVRLPAPVETENNTIQAPGRAPGLDWNGDGAHEILVQQDVDGDLVADEMTAWSVAGAAPTAVDRLAPSDDILAVLWSDPAANLLVFRRSAGFLEASFGLGRTAGSVAVGGFAPLVLSADVAPTPGDELLVNRDGVFLDVLTPDGAGGMATAWGTKIRYWMVAEAADLDADGDDEILMVDAADPANPAVTARQGDGSVIWSTPLTGYSTPPRFLTTGFFDGDGVPDVFVKARDTNAPDSTNERVIALRGSDGAVLWNRASDENIRSFAYPLIYDVDGDGRDDPIVLQPHQVEYYSGATGDLLATSPYRHNSKRMMLLHADADPEPELVVSALPGAEGLLFFDLAQDAPLDRIAYDYNEEIALRHPAVFAGTRGDAVVFSNAQGQIKAFWAADRSPVAWSPLWVRGGALFSSPQEGNNDILSLTVADVDGDGVDDILAGCEDGHLVAVRTADGALVWSAFLEEAVSHTITADVDGDGLSEVVAATQDGGIHVVDQRGIPAPEVVRDVAVGPHRIRRPYRDIDVTADRYRYGVTWSRVPGADAYRVTIVDENNLPVTPAVETKRLRAVIDTAPRLLGRLYRARVVAVSHTAGVSLPAFSDGLTATADARSEPGCGKRAHHHRWHKDKHHNKAESHRHHRRHRHHR